MNFRISFGTPKNVTNPGQRSFQWEFPFTLVNTMFIGAPEENSQTEAFRIIVPINFDRLGSWNLKGDNLVRVLFEYGKRFLIECIKADELPMTERTIRYDEITYDTHPSDKCPFDPSAIPWPDGVQLDVHRP